jgi:hypothetical protein
MIATGVPQVNWKGLNGVTGACHHQVPAATDQSTDRAGTPVAPA